MLRPTVKCGIKNYVGLLFVTPAMLLIFSIMILPLFFTLYCSLHNADYMQIGKYLGIDNFVKVVTSSSTWEAIGRTMVMTMCALVISLLIGFLLALWVDNHRNKRFAYTIQIVTLIPWVTSMVVGALLWKWILDGELGLANYFLSLFGHHSVMFLQKFAMPSLIFVVAWRTIGYSMVMIIAGLKSLPRDYIEAAQVDGANWFQTLCFIKIPMLKTPIAVATISMAMSNFSNNVIPLTLTSGGPGETTTVISLKLYRMGFMYYNFGEASALALFLFLINIIMVMSYVKVIKYEI